MSLQNNYDICDPTEHNIEQPDFIFSLDEGANRWMHYFDIECDIGSVHLSKENVSRFLHSDFADENIDSYFETLKSKHPECMFVEASWYGACLSTSPVNTLHSSSNWFTKEVVIIPINLENRHWILLGVWPKVDKSHIWIL